MRLRWLSFVVAGATLAASALTPTSAAFAGPGTVGTAAAKAPPRPRLGSPANPLVLTCADESFPGAPSSPVPQTPQRGDLVVGPLFIVEGKVLADADPAGYGEHGRYKVPIIVKMGRTVTMTIAPPARGEVVIDNPYSPVGGVVSATYHSCAKEAGFFAQGFAFTDHRARGCVPLTLRIGRKPTAHHVTLSLFAGHCPS